MARHRRPCAEFLILLRCFPVRSQGDEYMPTDGEQARRLNAEEKYDEALRIIESALKEFGDTTLGELKGEQREQFLLLRHQEALAHLRRGQLERATEILKGLVDAGCDDSETLGMYARTSKDRYYRSGDKSDLLASRDTYDRSFRSFRSFQPGLEEAKIEDAAYVGINAASMSVLLGQSKRAMDYCDVLTAEIGTPDQHNYWLAATVAEVQLIRAIYTKTAKKRREAFSEAGRLYGVAVDGSPGTRGSHGSTWLQAKRLMRAMKVSGDESARVWRAFRHLIDDAPDEAVREPPFRRLRVYAFDPHWARQSETATVNELTVDVPWEEQQDVDEKGKPKGPPHLRGPAGEYLEVLDFDPASGCFYEPINLNDRMLLAKDGMAPSEGEPQFHQQMVYAVGMNVIAHFERALGRRALWSSRLKRDDDGKVEEEFVPRLRIYPHALREPNAYYSPEKKALLFGYFPAESDDPLIFPGGTVFTCLSHDIIAHEMSHALLDGLHPRFAVPTNLDVLAFHEAFADIVALFQHFSHPEVLRYEVARSRGNLALSTSLGQLAQEFGRAIGRRGALRNAIGNRDDKGQWHRLEPDPNALVAAREPHERGAILVAAVFDAFLKIYENRTKDLIRIATQGSGILDPGEIHPDLVDRLAREAAKTATHILHICIRALDYCPPVDLTFGDYLRAMITADVDAVPHDSLRYRLAIIESFQRRGIYPDDVRNLSVESLVWRPPRGGRIDLRELFNRDTGMPAITAEWRTGKEVGPRRQLWEKMHSNAAAVHNWITTRCPAEVAEEIGLNLDSDALPSFYSTGRRPAVEVHSVRVAQRPTPESRSRTDLVVEILQKRRGYFDRKKQERVDVGAGPLPGDEHGDFTFRGGCTLLIDPATSRVRYAITKHILSDGRLQRQRSYLGGDGADGTSLRATYFGDVRPGQAAREPFAVLHSPGDF